MAKGNSWYYGLDWIVRLIIAIFPFIAVFVHLFARLTSGHSMLVKVFIVICGILFGWNGLWLVDLIFVILKIKLIFT